MGNAAGAAGLCALMAGEDGREWFARAASAIARAASTRRRGAGAGRSARSRHGSSPATGPARPSERAGRSTPARRGGVADRPLCRRARVTACSATGTTRVSMPTTPARTRRFPSDGRRRACVRRGRGRRRLRRGGRGCARLVRDADGVPRGRPRRRHRARPPGARRAARHGGGARLRSSCRLPDLVSAQCTSGWSARTVARDDVRRLCQRRVTRGSSREAAAASSRAIVSRPRTRLAGVSGLGSAAKARRAASAFSSPVTR